MVLDPVWFANLESRMQYKVTTDYLALASELWYTTVTTSIPSQSSKEILSWLLSTAALENVGVDVNKISFDEIQAVFTEVIPENFTGGLKLTKNQLSDLDGGGVQAAQHFAGQMGGLFALTPQLETAKFLKNGHLATSKLGYDGKPLFATDHPNCVGDSSKGTFANYFTGSADGTYPGALPVSGVTAQVALQNLATLKSYIANIPMPNGQASRYLKPVAVLAPTALMPTFVRLSTADFIAETAGSAAAQGGSGDIKGLRNYLGFGTPIEAVELGAAYGGSDSTFYVVCQSVASEPIGGVVLVNREPFQIYYHGPQDSATLASKREFQWTADGRIGLGVGLPYRIFKVLAS